VIPPHFCFGAPGPSVHDGVRRGTKLVGPLEAFLLIVAAQRY
jgi:hypothetical protein